MMKRDSIFEAPEQLPLSLVFAQPTVVPQGDGSVLVKPGKPTARLSPKELADIMGLTRSSIYRYVNEGLIPGRFVVPAGKSKYYIMADAVSFLHSTLGARRGLV